MGSFNVLCALSGFPITYKKPMKVVFLGGYPYGRRDGGIAPYGRWYPRAPALDSSYDDCGMVDSMGPAPLVELVCDQFKQDIVERGWGKNTFHDLPTSKDMDFDAILEAIRAKRLRVHEVDQDNKSSKIPEGAPTPKRISTLLGQHGIKVAQRSKDYGEITLSRLSRYTVRLRARAMSDGMLEILLRLIGAEYAVAQTTDPDATGDPTCLWIGPKPGVKNLYEPKKEKILKVPVDVAYIDADVWKWVCDRPVHGYTVETHLEQIQKYVELHPVGVTKAYEGSSPEREAYFNKTLFCGGNHQYKSAFPFMLGLGEALYEAALKKLDLRPFAEIYHITWWLSRRRVCWMPSDYGGQTFDYDYDRDFHGMLRDKAQTELDEEAKENDE